MYCPRFFNEKRSIGKQIKRGSHSTSPSQNLCTLSSTDSFRSHCSIFKTRSGPDEESWYRFHTWKDLLQLCSCYDHPVYDCAYVWHAALYVSLFWPLVIRVPTARTLWEYLSTISQPSLGWQWWYTDFFSFVLHKLGNSWLAADLRLSVGHVLDCVVSIPSLWLFC